MRAVVVGLCLLASAPAIAESIEQVLERSQHLRLQSLARVAEDDARALTIRRSLQRLLDEQRPAQPIELRIVAGGTTAECLLGRIIVVHAALGEVPEGERLFVLAHELGHVVHGHWAHLGAAFRRHVPGDVGSGDAAAVPALGREMSALAYGHEFDADAYALSAVHRLGYGIDAALASFVRNGVQHDTATHPGTGKRVAHLRARELERQ